MILSHTQRAALAVAAFVLMAGASLAADDDPPVVPPNAPKYVKSLQAPGLDVRYLDFKWDQEAFESVQKGSGSHPAGKRSWVLARVLATTTPFRCHGKIIPVGPSLLVLNPGRAGGGPTLELRAIDMREVFVDMNVIAEPPPGDTYYKGPAHFDMAETTAELLSLSLIEGKDTVDIVIHYGDRQATVRLVRS
jgi:hypothetical protein